jgi:hypothetical protein
MTLHKAEMAKLDKVPKAMTATLNRLNKEYMAKVQILASTVAVDLQGGRGLLTVEVSHTLHTGIDHIAGHAHTASRM